MILRPEVRTASLGQARSLQPVLPDYGQLLGGTRLSCQLPVWKVRECPHDPTYAASHLLWGLTARSSGEARTTISLGQPRVRKLFWGGIVENLAFLCP